MRFSTETVRRCLRRLECVCEVLTVRSATRGKKSMFIEVFDLPEFAEYGYVVWPDLWNARMADDGNTEAQYYGDSARPGHILWEPVV